MNNFIKTLFVVCLCFMVVAGVSGCSGVGNIKIDIPPTFDDPEGNIHFADVTVAKGTLEKDYNTIWSGNYTAGEPCFLITGHIANDSGTLYYLTLHADGLDTAGQNTSATLDEGPISGVAAVEIAPYSSVDFTLHQGWAKEIVKFVLHTQKSTIPPP